MAIRVWRRELLDAVKYRLDGSNLADVQALAGDGNWMLDGDGVLWVFDMLGDAIGGRPYQRMPRTWWLVRGPYPDQLTPLPPLWVLANFRTETDTTPEDTAVQALRADATPAPDPEPGERERALWKRSFDMVDEEAAKLAALGDLLGRDAEPEDLRRVVAP